jgi:P27 family predicted phage terminase small subunit
MLTTSKPRPVPAPKSLAAPERELWDKIVRSYTIDDPASQELLLQACEARGRVREARVILAREGFTYKDHKGNLKTHPCVVLERTNQQSFLAAIRALRLDINAED